MLRNGDDDAFERIRAQHQKGFDLLNEALKLDENFDSTSKKANALTYYRKGIVELEKGVSIELSRIRREAAEYERTMRLREKMLKNLKMAKNRVLELENLIKNPSARNFPTPKPFSTPRAAKTSNRSASPSRRTPMSSPLAPMQTQPKQTPQRTRTAEEISDHVKRIKGLDSKLAHLILDQVLEKQTNVSFADIAGLENAKRELREAVILPALNPGLFTGLRTPIQGLLLFGPPGNGKTMLAKAIAAEAKSVFFNVSASDLMSKWVGEAEKLVRTLFILARDLQPSVVFIDEIDSILCQRSQNEHEVTRRLKTEFLLQFDGVGSSSSDRILIMGATNRPFDLDEAVLRRLPKRLYVPLPDLACRQDLIQKLLNKHGHSSISSADVRSIAYLTDGYSSNDLTFVAKEAAMAPLREVPTERLTRMDNSQLRPLCVNDFREALRKVKPSTKREQLQELENFSKKYGTGA